MLVFYQAAPDITRHAGAAAEPRTDADCRRASTGCAPPQRDLARRARCIATYAPGTNPQVMPPGTAIRLEPGGMIELQMHYTATGKAGRTAPRSASCSRRTRRRAKCGSTHFFNATLKLPAGAGDVRVDADVDVRQRRHVWGIFPHTHLRGKKWQYMLELPDGTRKSCCGAALRLQLADVLHVQGAAAGAEGREADLERVVRQLAANRSNPDPKIDVTGATRRGKRCSTRD